MKHLRNKTRLFRRAALSLLTLVMAFTAQTAWAGYGWYDGAMTIGGVTTDCTQWSTDSNNPTDIGIVTDMTITSIAFNVWSDKNDRDGANMGFKIWNGGDTPVGVISEGDFWLGGSTRIAGDHDFAISWTGTKDLASAVGLTSLVPGKTYYIDMWVKTYGSYGSSGDEWYSGDNGSNYHAKLTYAPCGDGVTWSLSNNGATLTIRKTGSGTGVMTNYNLGEAPWYSNNNDITSVVIENGVTTIGDYAFSGCSNLASVSIPASVTSIGDGAFYGSGTSATTLTVNFAEGSTLTTIGNEAFHGAKLTSITIPANVTSIGNDAFYQCGTSTTALTVTFVTGSTHMTIGSSAFRETNLTYITIPVGVTSIGALAFKGCNNLATVTVYADPSTCSLDESAFSGCSNDLAIYVFSDKEEDFEKAEGWSNYAGIIQPNTNVTVSGVTAKPNPEKTTDYWCTYYHPQANVKINTSGVKMFKASLNEDNLTLREVEGDVIKAGQAVVLKAAASGNLDMELTSSAPTGNFDGNKLKGTSVAITGAAGNIYVLNAKKGTGAGFYKLSSNGTLGANKAYLIYGDPESDDPEQGGSNAREFLSFGDTTGINDVRGQKEDVRGEYYDLQGRRVSQPTKGLYIVNGKKVVIK